MNHFLHDIRVSLRSLLGQKSFTAIAVLTLALATGATTAIFSVVNGVLLRPLPFEGSERIVSIWQTPRDDSGPSEGGTVSHLNFLDWRREGKSLESMALYAPTGHVITGFADAEVVPGAIVSPNFFRVFNAAPIVGRELADEEDRPNGPDAIVISHGFWEERLGSRPDVLDATVEVSGRMYRVVGVAPAGFDFPYGARVWTTMQNDDEKCGRDCVYSDVVARLAPGATVESARAEMQAIGRRLERQYPDANTNVTVGITTLKDQIAGGVRVALLVLMAAVGMVLLIACANVANLLLVRGSARRSEVAIRAALGAGQGRLLSYLLSESVVLAMAGGVLGLAIAAWGVDGLRYLSPPSLPRLSEVAFDATTFAFALGTAGASALVFGLAPALEQVGSPLVSLLGGRGLVSDSRSRRGMSMLLVAEVGLCLVLLVGAGLLLHSLYRLQTVDPGFRPEGVTVFRLNLPSAGYPTIASVARTFEEIDRRVAALPGVEVVGRVSTLPLGGGINVQSVTLTDRPPPPPGRVPVVIYRAIDGEYFRALGIPLIGGRPFDAGDREGSAPVVIVSRTMADRYWPGRQVIGKQLRIGANEPRTIVGVAGNVRSTDLATPAALEMYVPDVQADARTLAFVIRSRQSAGQVIPLVRSIIRDVDPKLPLIRPGSLEELIHQTIARPRFYLLLLALFAALALVLAGVGVYGVVAYSVIQRTREIGIRMALGARDSEVVGLVLWQGLRPAALGIVLGLAGALVASRILTSLLYEVRPWDLVTLVGVTAFLLVVVLAACMVPARRAVRIAPASALRLEH